MQLPRSYLRHRATRQDSGYDQRKSRNKPSADLLRSVGSRRCTSLLCQNSVVINLLVWATRNTHAPATTFVLIDKYDTVVFTFVYRARWARSNTGRIKAMLAQTRQIHHER